jgi:hypothetical protein
MTHAPAQPVRDDRVLPETRWAALVVFLILVPAAFGDFDTSKPLTWLYLGGLVATAGAFALLHRSMEARISGEHRSATPAAQHVGA